VATGVGSSGGATLVTGVVVGSELGGGSTEVGGVVAGAESAEDSLLSIRTVATARRPDGAVVMKASLGA
jgi:hypothetical protein